MSEDTNVNDNDVTETTISPEDQLTLLKERADKMGIKYHPSIGADKLAEKIKEQLAPEPKTVPVTPPPLAELENKPVEPGARETENQRRVRLKREATRLVRVRITCMNPNKKDWEGELVAVGNSVVGTLKRYIPYNVEWHIPQIMLNVLQERQCQLFVKKKDQRGNTTSQGKLIKEFGIEILPDLSKEELHDLAQRQAMANGTAEAA